MDTVFKFFPTDSLNIGPEIGSERWNVDDDKAPPSTLSRSQEAQVILLGKGCVVICCCLARICLKHGIDDGRREERFM